MNSGFERVEPKPATQQMLRQSFFQSNHLLSSIPYIIQTPRPSRFFIDRTDESLSIRDQFRTFRIFLPILLGDDYHSHLVLRRNRVNAAPLLVFLSPTEQIFVGRGISRMIHGTCAAAIGPPFAARRSF